MSQCSRAPSAFAPTTLRLLVCLCLLSFLGLFSAPLLAQQAPEKRPDVAEKIVRDAALDIRAVYSTVGELPSQARADVSHRLQRLGADNHIARVDHRGGRFVTLAPATPLVPGSGTGNDLLWSDLGIAEDKALGPVGLKVREQAAARAFQAFLDVHAADLGIDPAELSAEHRITSHDDGRIFQVYVPRTFDGIPVRGSYLSAVINHGNLSLLGLELWGDRGPEKTGRPQIGELEARAAAEAHLAPLTLAGEWNDPQQVWLATARGNAPSEVQFRQGYDYRLAWSFGFLVEEDGGSWEVLVDARSGEILAAEDKNHYLGAKGGVLPVTNDGVSPDGVEQAGWPMPFMNVTGDTTDTGGNYSTTGNVTGNLSGTFIRMNDNCGSISLTQSGGLDFGTSGGTDCTTPGFGGSGNTHASRSGFYELNRMAEMARGQLPSNSWLQQQMTANMNINSTCNAYWNGSTVNFYRSGGGCANTGEIAGVFDHEWGHGMDDNDANPSIASPSGEGIADIYTALRLDTSCIGRNFRPGIVCSGFGDPCLTCTGVRDIDYLKRQSGLPHTYTWSNNNCGSSVHCKGAVYSEAVWSLWKRILQTSPYNYDNNTAHEIVNRLTFIGGGNVGTWFSGGPPYGGCGSSGGYLQYLAADDDNGNINDGTPHMQAIFEAFDDQEIACSSPTVQDTGCSGAPTSAPSVSATAGNQSVSLSWNSVSGASEYEIFRAEGIFQCDFGKVKVGSTTGTSFADAGLQNGRNYSYVVIPKGTSDACFGPASACDTASPSSSPDFSVSCSPSSLNIAPGTNDTTTCTVTSFGGYTGSVSLSCAGNPAGIGCSFSPTSVSPPSNSSANSTLTLSVSSSQSTGSFGFDVVGNDGSTSRTTGVTVDVSAAGSCDGTNCIDWDVESTTSFATQDASANFTVQDGGDTMFLQDNTWRRTTSTFNVTANTVVEFDFSSSSQGEIHGIGMDEDNTLSSNRIFKVHGTQSYGIQDFDNYAGGTVTYSIPVGTYFTGSSMNLLLVNDNDAGSGNNSTFSNVRVFEDGGGTGPCSLDDDFESGSATGWFNDAASTCSTGTYTLGDPTSPSGSVQIAGSNSGVYSIFTAANSSAGADDVDGGNCILGSPTWSVSNASTLSVWYWHGQRDAGDDSSGDFFRLEYSTDGGSSWSTLASNGDSASTATWTKASASVPASSSVKLRMQCSDGSNAGDLVECGLDDVSICE